MRKLLLVLVMVLVTGCGSVLDPWRSQLPDGAEEITPPVEFAELWRSVEQCSGLRRSMSEVRFFVVRGSEDVVVDGRAVAAVYQVQASRIVLGDMAAKSAIYRDFTVRHEMAHALLRKRGHPAWVADACKGLLDRWHD